MKEDDKGYDGWNNSLEKQIFDKELSKDIQLWEKSGMSNQQINEMIKFENQIFKSRRIYYTHNYSLFDDRGVAGTAIYIPESKPIYDFNDLSDCITDQRLIKAFNRYPTFKNISVLLAQVYDIKSIAKILKKLLTPYILFYLKLEK